MPPRAEGQVQKAFQGEKQTVGLLRRLFDACVGWASNVFGKLTVVKLLLPGAELVFSFRRAKNSARRRGVLETFKNVAEKRGVFWRASAAEFEARGLDVWESERATATDPTVVLPRYYEKHGVGTLHSYDRGNSCWAAAFDAPSAYMLVHLHHYPQLTPHASFDHIHDDMHSVGLARLRSRASLSCLDIGCGVGTSTFALQSCLLKAGLSDASIRAVDLSTYFVAVARFRNTSAPAKPPISFEHADGTALRGRVPDGSVDYVCVSEVTHELPQAVDRLLLAEAARVLKPGGVLAYLDLNPDQALRDNTVPALTERIALHNEPYFHEYLAFDMAAGMMHAGFTDIERTWVNKAKNATAVDCSLRILIATRA